MRVFTSTTDASKLENGAGKQLDAITIGTFDGMHIGHKTVIDRLIKTGKSMVVTFDPPPRIFISPEDNNGILTSVSEKIDIMKSMGLAYLLILAFDNRLANMPAQKFVDWLVSDLSHKKVLLGYNHRFGKERTGDFELLVHMGARLGFDVQRIPPVYFDGFPVSSTQIREFLKKGKIKLAKEFLGRYYSFCGKVVKGKGNGREIGYPTANLSVLPDKLIPKKGVYAVIVNRKDKNYKGMMYIGGSIEVHLFDFRQDILNEEIKVDFVQYIRENSDFPSPNALKQQLKDDEKEIRNLFEICNLDFKR